MATPSLTCSRCSARIPVRAIAPHTVLACEKCPALLDTVIFPALYRAPDAGRAGERVVFDTEASCFNHPDRRAEVACEGCGRFLCGLCDVTYHGRHLCPGCIATGGVATTEQGRLLHYDTIALGVFLLGMLMSFGTFGLSLLITSPCVLYLAIRHWDTPMSVLPRNRWRFMLAGSLAVLQLAGLIIPILLFVFG